MEVFFKDMSVRIENITDVALDLPIASRALLASRLLDSLDPITDANETMAAQEKVIRRRVEEIRSGTAKLIDGDVAFARIDKMIAE